MTDNDRLNVKYRVFGTSVVRTVMTLLMVLASVGALMLERELDGRAQAVKAPDAPKAEVVNGTAGKTVETRQGGSVSLARKVKMTRGEGYVRFKMELLNFDGTPFSQLLQNKRDEVQVYRSYLRDPDMPSFEAFNDEYHQQLEEYNRICAKGELVFESFLRADGSGLLDPGDFYMSHDENAPYSRTYTYKKKLKKGDTVSLYDSVVIPEGWQEGTHDVDCYIKQEGGAYTEEVLPIADMELIGSGYGIRVTAEVTGSDGSDNAAAAFSLFDTKGEES